MICYLPAVGQRDLLEGVYSSFNTLVKNYKSSFYSLRYILYYLDSLRQVTSAYKRDTQMK